MTSTRSSVSWCPAPGLLSTRVDGRLTILAPTADQPLALDDSAAMILELSSGRSLEEIVDTLLEMFDVSEDVLRHDVDRVVEVLARYGVLVPSAKEAGR
ncbi:PqqD family protein [Nostocoides jenkinsii]|uniref:Coenzyme PQQ synthesis protein D (PqqD) n=1 Tax=Nostocoides jenkinsii Ben 74 TaxID=1193518 RepID=A0A077MBL7_9MICO|nr:PqqD family protein [Tetrasphaera jenkinsii]CCI52058.1 hypothetical protein BN13_140050 [Tetrasphaera jenkinsii Ben 74]